MLYYTVRSSYGAALVCRDYQETPVSQVPIQETNKYTGKLFPIGLAIWFRIDMRRHVRRNTTVASGTRMGKIYTCTSTDERCKSEIPAFENYFLKHLNVLVTLCQCQFLKTLEILLPISCRQSRSQIFQDFQEKLRYQ